ncbi:MAG: DUF6719 family protein [Alphaproteobacteria bacterium]
MHVRHVVFPIAIGLLVAACDTARSQSEYLKSEPQDGTLPAGRTVYVDDGACPDGQVKKVTGGSRDQGTQRRRECVSK